MIKTTIGMVAAFAAFAAGVGLTIALSPQGEAFYTDAAFYELYPSKGYSVDMISGTAQALCVFSSSRDNHLLVVTNFQTGETTEHRTKDGDSLFIEHCLPSLGRKP